MKKIYTQYVRPEKKGETNSGELKVELKGYVPPQKQVENLMIAGKRLEDYRREAYDFGYGEKADDNYVDPTRKPDFDLADASRLADESNKKLKEQADKINAETKAKKEAEKAEYESWLKEKNKKKQAEESEA